jgi:deoxyribonuclease-4
LKAISADWIKSVRPAILRLSARPHQDGEEANKDSGRKKQCAMPWLGAHMSIAGGYYKAVEAAAALGMQTVQLFTKNNNQWRAKPLSEDDVRQFREAIVRTGVAKPCAHNSYLINLASPNDELWQKSLEALVVEVERAEALGLDGVVMHPGSHVESTIEDGLSRIVSAIDEVQRRTAGVRTELWLENTAGQGSNLGHRFEQLAAILQAVQQPERLGVCVDSCHLFAAGYPLTTAAEYKATFDEFDRVVGLQRLRAFHLNDSKKPFGSRVDRHEHIGEGCLGLEPFRHIVNDPRFAGLPMYLETEKGQRDGEELDAINLRTLRGLLK